MIYLDWIQFTFIVNFNIFQDQRSDAMILESLNFIALTFCLFLDSSLLLKRMITITKCSNCWLHVKEKDNGFKKSVAEDLR